MGKRFTATEKWNDGWFLGLSKENKLIWCYILDTCTNAGRWIKNFKMLNFCCEANITEEDFKNVFNGRVIDFDGFFFIPKFLRFQYPKGLNSFKPAVLSVKNEILQYGLLDIVRQSLGNDYLIIKDKDKDTDKDKETETDKEKDLYKDWEKTVLLGWNTLCSKYPLLSPIKEISGTRREKLKKRFEQASFRDFASILKVIPAQRFLMGENERKWKVSFDWLITNDNNYLKVLECNYREKNTSSVKAADPDCQECAGTGWVENEEGKKVCRCRIAR